MKFLYYYSAQQTFCSAAKNDFNGKDNTDMK